MIGVRISNKIRGYCDWCAKPVTRDLTPIVLVTPRGTFTEHVCDPCAETIAQEDPR